MEFRRWGNLAIQKHSLKDKKWFHTPPVEKGIYAFPKGIVEKGILDGIGNGSIRNGRCSYVRDSKGRKVMMSYDDWDSIRTVDGPKYKQIIIDTPDGFSFLKGKVYDEYALYAEKDGVRCWPKKADDGAKVDDTLYPLVKVSRKPTKFEYKGNIWHHLETTDPMSYFEKEGGKYKRLVEPCDIIKRSGSWILTDIKTYQKTLKKAKNIFKYVSVKTERKEIPFFWDNHEGHPLKIKNRFFFWDEFEVFIEKL